MLVAPEVLYDLSDDAAFRMPVHKAGAAFFVDAEDVKVSAKPPVVALLSLLQHLKVAVKFFNGGKCSSVYPLQHLVFLIAPPVGPCNAQELKRFDFAGRLKVRASTEVYKLTLTIEAYHLILRHVLY